MPVFIAGAEELPPITRASPGVCEQRSFPRRAALAHSEWMMIRTTLAQFSPSSPKFNLLRVLVLLAGIRRNSLAHVRDACLVRGSMGHCKGKDNVKKRAARRKKAGRLALAKSAAAAK
jgi:hypothetical protein